MSEILVKLEVTQGRRMFGVSSIAGLGLTLLYIGAFYPPSKTTSLFILIAIGGLFVWSGRQLFRATQDTIILTREAIATESGRTLCRIKDIDNIDRGFFAFKPSNGFLVKLKQPAEKSWAPGMWWAFGKHVGIGGVTSPRQGKEMASIAQMLVAEHKLTEANRD